jgi:acyl-CoA reductase-like NAD-dependent aldehyde dehydrogenase
VLKLRPAPDKIANLSQQEAEKLIANSSAHVEEEAQQIYRSVVRKANHSRDEKLGENQKAVEELRARAERSPSAEKIDMNLREYHGARIDSASSSLDPYFN